MALTEIPDEWSHDCDGKGVKVEVLSVDNPYVSEWVEIPTTSVELYVNKDGVADIQRTAKVEFPMEWAGQPVIDLINGFRPDDVGPFTFARISFRKGRDMDNPWEIAHFGFVGGTIGKSGEPGVSRMWVYDMADLLGGMPVGVTFDRTKADNVMGSVANRLDDVLPSAVNVDTELLESLLGPLTITDPDGEPIEQQVDRFLPSKTFQNNRDTLIDVMDWVASQTGTDWYFEPQDDGVTLTIDADPAITLFQQDELVDDSAVDTAPWDNTPEAEINEVRVIDNEALSDLEPINTIIVRGETTRSSTEQQEQLGITEASAEYLGDVVVPSKKFPVVKVRAWNIYERQGIELAAPIVESDDITIEDARQTARVVLAQKLSQSSEGEIILYGEPGIKPDAIIDALPTCQSKVETTDIPPIRYEVEEVKHIKESGDIFKTELRVSIFAKDAVVVEERMEDVENAEGFDPLLTPISPGAP